MTNNKTINKDNNNDKKCDCQNVSTPNVVCNVMI